LLLIRAGAARKRIADNGKDMTALHVLLGIVQLAIGVAMIMRREQLAPRSSRYSLASRRGLLLILGIGLVFVGVIQIAEAFV
jgi:hypothetical protein